MALEIFEFQRANNQIYAKWAHLLQPVDKQIKSIADLPFLPINLFKNNNLNFKPSAQITFSSSSTTGQGQSFHPVFSLDIYEKSCVKAFELSYGSLKQYHLFALLPNYLEREGSSLIYMVNHFIKNHCAGGGFYLHNYNQLQADLQTSLEKNQPTILLGVTFALLDFAHSHPLKSAENLLVMETGGMKGRGPELTRFELHSTLQNALGVSAIHSEYGMTELLSQAYSLGNGRFNCPPWMKILIQDPADPLQWMPHGKTGRVCVIDLANVYSCSFIATDDLGKLYPDGSFEILGRLDFSDVRGCSQLSL